MTVKEKGKIEVKQKKDRRHSEAKTKKGQNKKITVEKTIADSKKAEDKQILQKKNRKYRLKARIKAKVHEKKHKKDMNRSITKEKYSKKVT